MVHILFVLGLALVGFASRRTLPYLLARRWLPARATVISISETWVDVPMRYKPLKYYFPKIVFEYEIYGRTFRSNRTSFEKENIWQPEVDLCGVPNAKDEFFWAKWIKGTPINVYVNPGNLSESVIVRDLNRKRRSHHLAVMVSGIIVVFLWAVLVYASNY